MTLRLLVALLFGLFASAALGQGATQGVYGGNNHFLGTTKLTSPNGAAGAQPRQALSATLNMYVNGDSGSSHPCVNGTATCLAGSDSNTCLSVSSPCLTLTHVLNALIYPSYDLAQHSIAVWLAENTGTTNYSLFCAAGSFVGGANVDIHGNINDPTLTTVLAPNGGYAFSVKNNCGLSLYDFQIKDQGSSAGGVHSFAGAWGGGVDLRSINFAGDWNVGSSLVSSSDGGAHVLLLGASPGSVIPNQISTSGTIGNGFFAANGGEIDFVVAVDIPTGFAVNAAQWFAAENGGLLVSLAAGSFTGAGRAAVTGKRCFANGGYIGNTNPNLVFPGSTNCVQVNVNSAIYSQTVADLPTCSASIQGAQQWVTDSNTATWGANIAAGGANKVLGVCNTTNWTVMGK